MVGLPSPTNQPVHPPSPQPFHHHSNIYLMYPFLHHLRLKEFVISNIFRPYVFNPEKPKSVQRQIICLSFSQSIISRSKIELPISQLHFKPSCNVKQVAAHTFQIYRLNQTHLLHFQFLLIGAGGGKGRGWVRVMTCFCCFCRVRWLYAHPAVGMGVNVPPSPPPTSHFVPFPRLFLSLSFHVPLQRTPQLDQ